jgi:hypothetical protein
MSHERSTFTCILILQNHAVLAVPTKRNPSKSVFGSTLKKLRIVGCGKELSNPMDTDFFLIVLRGFTLIGSPGRLIEDQFQKEKK